MAEIVRYVNHTKTAEDATNQAIKDAKDATSAEKRRERDFIAIFELALKKYKEAVIEYKNTCIYEMKKHDWESTNTDEPGGYASLELSKSKSLEDLEVKFGELRKTFDKLKGAEKAFGNAFVEHYQDKLSPGKD